MGNSDNTVFYRDNNGNLRVFNTNEYMNKKIRNEANKKKNKDEEEMVTLYHGSPYEFDKFDLEKSHRNRQYVNIDEGHYFTDVEEIARENYGGDGYVYEVKVPKSKVKKSGTYLGQGDYENNIFVVNDDNVIEIVKRNKINKYYNKYNVKEELNEINKKIKTSEKFYDRFKDNPDFIKEYNEQKERRDWLNSIPKYDNGEPVSIETKLYSINEDIKKVKKNIQRDKENNNFVSVDYLNDRLQELEKRKKQLEKQKRS